MHPISPHHAPFARRVLLVALGLPLAALTGCAGITPAQMPLPASLAPAARQVVAGRQGWKIGQELFFGPHHVYDVERSLTKGSDLQILAYDGSKRRQLYSFTLADATGPAWVGNCEAFMRRQQLRTALDIELRKQSALGARFTSLVDPADAWDLKLTERGGKSLTGTLNRDGVSLDVTGTNRLAGTSLPLDETTGYTIAHHGRVLAAVEVINDGAVWLADDLTGAHRGPVIAAASALLLFEELRASLRD